MAPAAHSQRNAAEILGQAVKPPERIAIGSRAWPANCPGTTPCPGSANPVGGTTCQPPPTVTATSHHHPPVAIKVTVIRSYAPEDEQGPGAASRTAGPGSPTPNRWLAWPGSRPSPADPAPASPTASGGRSTASSATPFATSPTTPGTPARGQRPSTTRPAPAARTTRTPSASPPAPGSMSSGATGKNSVAYDPAKHNALQNILARQQAGGAAAAGPRTPGDGRGQRRAARLRGRHLPRRSSPRSS